MIKCVFYENCFTESRNYGHELKGPAYISLSRQQKSEIIWEKLIADTRPGLWHIDEVATSSNEPSFDHKGDEFDCSLV